MSRRCPPEKTHLAPVRLSSATFSRKILSVNSGEASWPDESRLRVLAAPCPVQGQHSSRHHFATLGISKSSLYRYLGAEKIQRLLPLHRSLPPDAFRLPEAQNPRGKAQATPLGESPRPSAGRLARRRAVDTILKFVLPVR